MDRIFRKLVILAIFLFISTIPIASALSINNTSSENPISNSCAPPIIEDFFWELEGDRFNGWTVTFTMRCYDEMSGMDRVEFSLDGEVMHIDDSEQSPYIWVLEDPFDISNWHDKVMRATAFDKAGNSAYDEFDCAEIKTKSHIRSLNQIFSNTLIFQILERLLGY